MKKIAYVGNDVHQDSITVSVYVGDEREPSIERQMLNERKSVEKFYKRLSQEYEVRACYEASSNGYVFYRWLKELGVSCEVIAPSLIPEKRGDRQKTDKRDARKLGRYYRSGDLTTIKVPSEKEEASRSLLRLREQMSREVRNAKQYLLKFLQLRGLSYKEGTNWTLKHREYLKGLKFEERLDVRVFDEYMLMLGYKEEALKKIDDEIYTLAYGEEYRGRVERMTMLRGVKETTAMGLITEIVDFKRFSRPREMMAYLGLIPGERSSGEEQKFTGITKAGNPRVRRLMVEAAWHYRHKPVIKKRAGSDLDESWEIAQRAQRRLHDKYWRLIQKGKCKTKAATAVARELTGFIWAIMQTA
ncbi:MAG: IS110 family transposase [Candidatus Omnitrophica bacterium]|nr:IS110 family transposase [Candidatus Omnitrophota bacterium]